MPGVRGVPHPHRGHPQTQETRDRIRASLLARHSGSGHPHGLPSSHPANGGDIHGNGRPRPTPPAGGGHGTPASRRRAASAAHPNADTRRRTANAQRGLDAAMKAKAAEKQHHKDLAKAHLKDMAGAFGKGWAAGKGKGGGDVHAAVNKVKNAAKRKFPKPPSRPSH